MSTTTVKSHIEPYACVTLWSALSLVNEDLLFECQRTK